MAFYEACVTDSRSTCHKRGRFSYVRDFVDFVNLSVTPCDALWRKQAVSREDRVPDIIPQLIRIFDQPVSAGPGNFLEGDEFEEYPHDASVPAEATFGIRISGDSMKPFCNTSDVLWVHSQNTLEHNETGIFLLDGQAYCKKLQSNKKGIALVSLNKKYQPIPVNEYSDFRVLGKVVGKR